MNYGLCNLSIVPLRLEDSDRSEMVSQVLYGDLFELLKVTKKWSRIRLTCDSYEGWIDNKQFVSLTKNEYDSLNQLSNKLSTNLLDIITTTTNELLPISLGSNVAVVNFLNHSFEGKTNDFNYSKTKIIEISNLYLNSPYLWGGNSPYGIDCSGLTQMTYLLYGIQIPRDASDQATFGETLNLFGEAQPGDLIFFDNAEGVVTHVGILLPENKIIHASGHCRIDKIDHQGIFREDWGKYTHKTRIIKSVV